MLKAETNSKKRESLTFYRYSECFKGKVVQEVSEGSSISEVCHRYDIKNMSTVYRWIKKYGRRLLYFSDVNTVIRVKMRSEDDKIKQLELEIKRLKISLADATLAKELLEKLVEMADDHCQPDLNRHFYPSGKKQPKQRSTSKNKEK